MCTHQKLPLVNSSTSQRFYVDPKVRPVVCNKPGNIPLHLQAEVMVELDKDVRLGVLRKVSPDAPVHLYLHRMVMDKKRTKKVRRTVDLKPPNRVCPRQTHVVEPPILEASSIPARSWKTCLGAKEGYHFIPIHKDDQKHTAFLTPWGRYEYLVTPQGHLATRDSYCQRYDEITREFTNYKQCVDNTCLWADTIEDNFRRTCQVLTHCSKNGIIVNELNSAARR